MMTFLPRTSRCLYAFRAVGLIAVAAAMLPWVPLQAQVNPVEVSGSASNFPEGRKPLI